MILYDEVYFEITVSGAKSDIKKFSKYLKGGAIDDYFEVCSDFFSYDDDYASADDADTSEMIFSNDDFGIEIDKLDVEDFLDVFCKETANLDVSGHVYDINDDEYSFVSAKGRTDYSNALGSDRFKDELDELADSENY